MYRKLEAACTVQAKLIAEKERLQHTWGSNVLESKRTFTARAKTAGYKFGGAENIAYSVNPSRENALMVQWAESERAWSKNI
jgi:uncharacterized protein YkwD